MPFIYGSLKSQRLEISVNSVVVYQDSISIARDYKSPIVIDLTNVPVSDEYIIEFNMPDATSPKKVGFNKDPRELAFSVKRITFR